MQNLEIIVLSSIVSTLFLVFLVAIYREIKTVDENSYKTMKDGGPRVQMIKFIGGLFDSEEIPKDKKIQNIEIVYDDEETDSRER